MTTTDLDGLSPLPGYCKLSCFLTQCVHFESFKVLKVINLQKLMSIDWVQHLLIHKLEKCESTGIL